MRLLLSLALVLLAVASHGQKDPTLKTRLDEYIKITEEMDFEKIMDYTYPRLFSLIKREELVEVMRQTFSNDEVTIKLDSLRADSIYPIFQLEGGNFAKVTYSMRMLMKFHQPGDTMKMGEMMEMVKAGLTQQFGEDRVSIDAATNTVIVQMIGTPMVAIKDSLSKEWTFVNLKPEDPLTAQLLSEAVLAKLATYK